MNSDRFKFRVWLKKEQCYIENDADICEITHDGELVCIDWGDGDTIPKTEYAFDDCVVEQCTGLKDQSGKLIFEGDVVRTITGFEGTVKWINEQAMFQVVFKKHIRTCDVHESQEIIGNIHEVEK